MVEKDVPVEISGASSSGKYNHTNYRQQPGPDEVSSPVYTDTSHLQRTQSARDDQRGRNEILIQLVAKVNTPRAAQQNGRRDH